MTFYYWPAMWKAIAIHYAMISEKPEQNGVLEMIAAPTFRVECLEAKTLWSFL